MALTLTLESFGYKYGLPQAQMILDVRCLENPYWVPGLRELTGRDRPVQEYILGDPRSLDYLQRLEALLQLQLQLARQRGAEALHIAIGCTGGQHRSVCVCEYLARQLAPACDRLLLRHRQLDETT